MKRGIKMNQDKMPLTHEEEEELLRKYMRERANMDESTKEIFISSNWLQQNGERYLTPEENINKQQMYKEINVVVEEPNDSWDIIRKYEEEVFKRDKDKIVKEIIDEIDKRG